MKFSIASLNKALVGALCLLFSTAFINLSAQSTSYQHLSSHSYGASNEVYATNVGTASEPANNVSEIVLAFKYDYSLGSIDFDAEGGWFGNASDIQYTIDHDGSTNDVEVRISRIDGTVASGNGFVGHLVLDGLGIIENLDHKRTHMSIALVQNPTADLQLFPQPAADYVQIRTEGEISEMDLYDLQGRKLDHFEGPQNRITFPQLAPGTYILTGTTTQGSFREKLLIQ